MKWSITQKQVCCFDPLPKSSEFLRFPHFNTVEIIAKTSSSCRASRSGFFFDRAKKTQGRKNSKLKQKTQGFGKFWCNLQQKSTEMTKKQGGNY